MARSMPRPDEALKEFFMDNEVYADLFNSFLFGHRQVIDPEELEPGDTAYAITIGSRKSKRKKYKTEKINKYRDNVRRTSKGYLVILGIEDQDKIHYAMPVRKILYDALSYSTELSAIADTQDQTSWTVDERLSKVSKGTTITPIITIVFYTGEKPWDGPRSLHDMMVLSEDTKPFVPDYPLYIIDIGHDMDLSFNSRKLAELRNILFSIYADTAEQNNSLIDSSTIALAGILSNDENLYYAAIDSEGGKQEMSTISDEKYRRIREEKDAEYAVKIAQMQSEIDELKRQLAEATKQN